MRVNGPIKVYNPGDTVPLDAEGGYAGGDSTAAAVGTAQAQALSAVAAANETKVIVGGGIATTTATARNLNPYTLPASSFASWSTGGSIATTLTQVGDYVRATATAAGDGAATHGLRTTPRPGFTAGGFASMYAVAEVRLSAAGPVRAYVQFFTDDASPVTVGSGTLHNIGTDWTWVATPLSVPAVSNNFRAFVTAGGPFAAGHTLDVRHAGILTVAGAYWDGSTTDTTSTSVDVSHAWDGAVNTSTSTRTTTTRAVGAGLGGRTVIQAINDVEDELANITPGGGAAGTLVPPPAGFALNSLPLPDVRRNGPGFTTDAEQMIDSLRPPAGVTYYVAPVAFGDGTSAATPTTFATARAKPDVGTIVFAPGEYDRAQGYVAGRTTKNLNYIAGGPGVRLTGWSQALTWTLASGNVYAATRSAAVSVGDPRIQYATDGVLAMYAKQTGTTAAAVTAAGQWATNGTTVWAWAHGNTNLATNPTTLRVGMQADVGVMHTGSTAYVEGITIEGAASGYGMDVSGGTLLLRDCTIQGADNNGVTCVDTTVIAVRTDVSASGMDGFNYHGACDFIEVDCSARYNGWKRVGTNNGSTSHETSKGVRVGGRYADCFGPLIADVNSAQTWTVGATTERNDAAMLPSSTQRGHYHADGASPGSTVAHMWVQDATLTGLGVAWRASTNATLSVRDPRKVTTDLVASVDAGASLDRW